MSKCGYQTKIDGLSTPNKPFTAYDKTDSNGRYVYGSRHIGQQLGIGKSSVNDHRAGTCSCGNDDTPTAADTEVHESSGDHNGANSYREMADTAWGADEWRDFIRAKGQDPDKVTFQWGVTSNPHGGYWNKLWNVRPIAGADTIDFDLDPVAILAALRANGVPEAPFITTDGAESTFGISINDIQLGQSYNGGSAATIEQFYKYITQTLGRVKELRSIGRRLERLVIVVGGDLGEGCVIYPNQSFNLDMDRKQQQQGIVSLLLHAIDTLAPLFESVLVLACKGNHGEHRINGKMTTLNDNDDTLAVEMCKLALSRDPARQHIEWVIAGEEAAVSTRVYDWVLTTTHGDVYAKGVSGPTTERKAHAWMKNMAAGRKRFGDLANTDVLITHHFHHDEMADWGDTLWRQTPSQDRGSPGFSQATGTYSVPGMLTFVMTPDSRWQDESVLR